MASVTEVEEMVVRLTGDDSGYRGMLARSAALTSSVAAHIGSHADAIAGLSSRVQRYALTAVTALGPLAGIGGLVSTAIASVKQAAANEKLEIEFGVLLKDDDAGKELTKRLQKLAADTPLNLPELQRGAKQLLISGVGGNNVVGMLKTVGDVALGDADKMQHLLYALGQVRSMGMLHGQELLQFNNAGFNPLQEISRTSGKSMAQLREDMTHGKISFSMVMDAFRSASSKGGDFFNGMEKQSKSLVGVFSTMQDDVGASLRDLGIKIANAFDLKELMKRVSGAAGAVKDAFAAVPDWVPRFAAAVAVAVVVVGGLAVGLVAVKAALLTVGALAVSTFGWWLVPLGLVVALIAAFIVQSGGLSAALDRVGAVLKSWWDWLLPVRKELAAIAEVARTAIASGFESGVAAALAAWRTLTGGMTVDWGAVRDAMLTGLIAVEYAMRNSGQVANLVWAGMRYYAEAFVNYAVYAFTVLLPAAALWFWNNSTALAEAFGAVWAAQWVYYKDVAVAVFESINWDSVWDGFKKAAGAAVLVVAGLMSMTGKLATMPFDAARAAVKEFMSAGETAGGGKSLGDRLGEITEKYKDKLKGILDKDKFTPFAAPDRIPPETETRLKEEYERLGSETAESFDEFRRRRLKSLMSDEFTTDEGDPYKNLGEDRETDDTAKANKHHEETRDAVERGSAEAARRIQAYSDNLREGRGGLDPANATAKNTAEANKRLGDLNETLKDRLPKGGGGVAVVPANLSGAGDSDGFGGEGGF